MNLWPYYARLALLDLWRLRRAVLPQLLVVAGICLPVLLLRGLERGHVRQLRHNLLTSPTGRQVRFWTTQEGELLTPTLLARLAAELPGVDLVIPDTHHVGALAAGPRRAPDVTFETTRRGDPVLALAGCDVLGPGERAVVLSRALAEQLAVAPGDAVRLEVSRQGGEPARLGLRVKAVDPRGGRHVAYLEVDVQRRVEGFLRGGAVPEYGWPATAESAADTYTGYLLFCRAGDDLTAADRAFYERDRNFRLEPVRDEVRRTLYGLLRPHGLSVYLLHKDGRRLRDRPDELAERTGADEVLVPWCEPVRATVAGQPHRLVGLSLPRRSWLRTHLVAPESAFDYDAPERSISLPFGSATGRVEVAAAGVRLELAAGPRSGRAPWKGPGPPPAAVPAPLAAHLDMLRHGLVQYDPAGGRFVPAPEEVSYARARLFARTIDDVPAVTAALAERNLAFESRSARIREIRRQAESLEFIVLAVSAGVLGFGVFTVANVLLDSTGRKRGTLGILRVMGASRGGVFFLVVLRAALIGAAAGGLTLAGGAALAWALRGRVAVALEPADLLAVFGSAVVCCTVGSLYPAWTASRVDPYETVLEGKFR